MSSTDTSEDDGSETKEALNRLFAATVQIAGLPVAALGIINLIATHYHVQLLPLGRDIVSNYQLATSYIVGGLYWVPLHFFHWTTPPWFHDLAVISIVSSSVSWRAFSGKDNPLTQWQVSLTDMLRWQSVPPGDGASAFDWISYILAVVPMFLVNMSAWFVGNVMYVFRQRWLSGLSAATVRVVLRGLVLIGLLILARHVASILAPMGHPDAVRAARRAAATYFLYFGVVIIAVFFFFGQLGARGLF